MAFRADHGRSFLAGSSLTLLGDLFGTIWYEMIRNSVSGSFGGFTGLVVYTVLGAFTIIILTGISMWGVGAGTDWVLQSFLGASGAGLGEAHSDAEGVGNRGSHSVGGAIKEGITAGRQRKEQPDGDGKSSGKKGPQNESEHLASEGAPPPS